MRKRDYRKSKNPTSVSELFLNHLGSRVWKYLNNVIFQVLWHVSVGHLCKVVVWLWPPTVNTIKFEQKTGFPVIVAIVFFRNTFYITSLWRKSHLFRICYIQILNISLIVNKFVYCMNLTMSLHLVLMFDIQVSDLKYKVCFYALMVQIYQLLSLGTPSCCSILGRVPLYITRGSDYQAVQTCPS